MITAAERAEPALRAVTLLQLARSRATADLVDPEQLVEQTLSLSDSPSERVERDEVLRGLFGILLVRRPGAALRLLYEQTTASWAMATALLENAVGPLLDARGTDGAILLHRAVRRALACTSTQDTGDSSIDGVRTTLGD
ncbi:hypothetical protein ACFYR1_49920 [Streptomyces canus]|uniref:hypothetical protein n=1 Tax=Streptomyces canus TaxID=58343 RepID=UPI0036B2F877